jgi:septal ring factor EnvC (AmiA/AmiB activator)
MVRYAQHLFQLQHNTQRIIAGQHRCLSTYVREVKSLEQEIRRMAHEHGALRQQLRALESRIRDKDQEILTIYRRSTERDQELHRHRISCARQRRPPP